MLKYDIAATISSASVEIPTSRASLVAICILLKLNTVYASLYSGHSPPGVNSVLRVARLGRCSPLLKFAAHPRNRRPHNGRQVQHFHDVVLHHERAHHTGSRRQRLEVDAIFHNVDEAVYDHSHVVSVLHVEHKFNRTTLPACLIVAGMRKNLRQAYDRNDLALIIHHFSRSHPPDRTGEHASQTRHLRKTDGNLPVGPVARQQKGH